MKYSLSYFEKKSWTFVLIKDGKIIFRSKAERLKPLIFCIKKYRREIRGITVFDKVVGRAAAVLLAHARVGEVWTPTVSTAGKTYLLKNKIKMNYKQEVKNIMNRGGNDFCPMEKLSLELGAAGFTKYVLKE